MEKNTRGITLIALIITIIVMLILVAVTIRISKEGALFGHAGNAVKQTRNEIAREQGILNGDIQIGMDGKLFNSIEDFVKGKELETFSEIYTETAEYKENGVTTAWIPKGFAVGTSDGINKVANGLVIQDDAGNQFVWIPVNVATTEEFDNIRTTKNDEDVIEPYEDCQEEYEAMRASVMAKGGFYIARYEAGFSMTTGGDRWSERTVATPISKKLAFPYFNVSWNNAREASHLMYNNSSKYGVKSTLCYGVQWDAMISFLGKTGETDSTSWGNYGLDPREYDCEGLCLVFEWENDDYDDGEEKWKDCKQLTDLDEYRNVMQTGASERNKLKNLYDVAGSSIEWIMEKKYASRGWPSQGYAPQACGSWFVEECCAAPMRSGSPITLEDYYGEQDDATYGFRPALYID